MKENYLVQFLAELLSKDILYTRMPTGNIKITFGIGYETVDISITERFFDKDELEVMGDEYSFSSYFGVRCHDIEFYVENHHNADFETIGYEDDEAGENRDFSLTKDYISFVCSTAPTSYFDASTLVYQDALSFCETLISIHRLMFEDEINGRS